MSWNVADVKVFAGRLGGTSQQPVQVTGDAGESFSAPLHQSINLANDPELLDQWASGELHVVRDPLTGTTHRLTMPIVCHDPRRRVFALVVPGELRWCEYRLRQNLLEELARETEDVPAYVRNFVVLYDLEQLRALESGVLDEPAAADALQELEATKELARQRQQLEEARENLRSEREQLDEIRERFDRERSQMDGFEERLQAERAEVAALKATLEAERREIQAARLNAEARALNEAHVGTASTEESTQVVTDDQFIEIVEDGEIEESFAEESEVEEVAIDDTGFVSFEPTDRAPDKLSDLISGVGRTRAVKIVQSRVVAVAQLPRDRVAKLLDGAPTFFVQLHEVDGYPLVALLLAQLDDRQQATETYAWTLDPAADADRVILDSLQNEATVTLAFYGPDGKRVRATKVHTPFASNVAWIRRRADELLGSASITVTQALEAFSAKDYESLGTMRHNFTQESFVDATKPSQIQLAAGIVGYWSKPDTFEYLIANRCFPLNHFRAIQERVVRRAADAGIFLNQPLRNIALELGVASTEGALVDLLIANFAEACISLRANDLESAAQWENWDALLGLGEELGLPPDPEVVELAEVSLKRAQEAEEIADRVDAELTTVEDPRLRTPADSLVVAKRSESTGVTYFLPNDAVLDTFDDLATMERDDLELLLNDSNGRLEAAQMLIERFGTAATPRVLEATEKMNAAEVAAIAKFLESKAGGLEGELVRCVESGGPNATYVAARALGKVKSTSAIPALIDALQDESRTLDRENLAEAIAEYGDKLMPALTRAIKRDGPLDNLVLLLSLLEERVDGTLSTLSKDRSKNLREAARMARQRRESKSA